jgi:hypothetical protein
VTGAAPTLPVLSSQSWIRAPTAALSGTARVAWWTVPPCPSQRTCAVAPAAGSFAGALPGAVSSTASMECRCASRLSSAARSSRYRARAANPVDRPTLARRPITSRTRSRLRRLSLGRHSGLRRRSRAVPRRERRCSGKGGVGVAEGVVTAVRLLGSRRCSPSDSIPAPEVAPFQAVCSEGWALSCCRQSRVAAPTGGAARLVARGGLVQEAAGPVWGRSGPGRGTCRHLPAGASAGAAWTP